jgi:hypothetical protein
MELGRQPLPKPVGRAETSLTFIASLMVLLVLLLPLLEVAVALAGFLVAHIPMGGVMSMLPLLA